MYFVYILYSYKDFGMYVGCTQDVEKRIKRHNSGFVYATKNRRPLSVIYSENFQNKGDAFQRERFLKTLWSARFKKKVLSDFLKLNKTNTSSGESFMAKP